MRVHVDETRHCRNSERALLLAGVVAGEEKRIGAVRDVDSRVLFHLEQTEIGGVSTPAPVMIALLLQFGLGELGRLNCTVCRPSEAFRVGPRWMNAYGRACPRHW